MALRHARSKDWVSLIPSVTNSLNEDFQSKLGGLTANSIYKAGLGGDSLVRETLAKLGKHIDLPNNSSKQTELKDDFLSNPDNDQFKPDAYVYADFSVKGELGKKESDRKVRLSRQKFETRKK